MASIRRSIKNVSRGLAPCERDVREATSNDKRLPHGVVQARIAHATYDMMTSPLVMAALWKRLNDTGKNWRHVYKSLILLEYLLKAGADHIVLEVRSNMFALQTLTDFQYVGKSGVDKGINVREHARAVIALLSDEPRLQAARDEGRQTLMRYTAAAGRQAQAQPLTASRAKAVAAKPGLVLMPNGEMPPDPRVEEHRQVRLAQQVSAADYASTPGAAMHLPMGEEAQLQAAMAASLGRPVHAPTPSLEPGPSHEHTGGYQTEEEMLAAAMAASLGLKPEPPSPVRSPVAAVAPGAAVPVSPQAAAAAEREALELAQALSLSMVDQEARARLELSSDEEDDDEVTPPSTPFENPLFGQSAGDSAAEQAAGAYFETLPRADADAGYIGVAPGGQPAVAEAADTPPELVGASPVEMEQYLQQDSSFGS